MADRGYRGRPQRGERADRGKSMPDIAVDWIWLCPTLKLRLES